MDKPANISELSAHPPPVDEAVSERVLSSGFALQTMPVESRVDLDIERELARRSEEECERGYRMYLAGETPQKIAEEMSITQTQVLFWSRRGHWVERLKKENDDKERLVKENLRAIRLASAGDDATSSIRLGRRIREVAEAKLEGKNADAVSPMGLMNIANAGKAGGDLTSLGRGETEAAATAAAAGKQPLVIVFKDGMPPVREKFVDVTERNET